MGKPTCTDRDEARECFAEAELAYHDLSVESIERLRDLVNACMRDSKLFRNTFRTHKKVEFDNSDYERLWAGIKCRSDYFTGREAVSFNPDGFIGFAGWADSENVIPILEGFTLWVEEMRGSRAN